MTRSALVVRSWVVVAFLGGTLLAATAPVQADIVIPGRKNVRRDAIVDFGPYADRATGSYKVQSGDTISALAKKHLGAVGRQKEILELNPGLTPEKLKAGATILMPPRVVDAKQGWDFFAVVWGANVERVFHGQRVPYHHYWTSLWAVPRDKSNDLLKMAAVERNKKRDVIEILSKEPWIAKAEAKLCGRVSLSDGSPIASVIETYRVQKIEKGKIVLKKTATQNLDKRKKPIATAGITPHLTPGNGLLILLAACGASGLGFLMLRRRADTQARTVESA